MQSAKLWCSANAERNFICGRMVSSTTIYVAVGNISHPQGHIACIGIYRNSRKGIISQKRETTGLPYGLTIYWYVKRRGGNLPPKLCILHKKSGWRNANR